jgi:hypothetical protein
MDIRCRKFRRFTVSLGWLINFHSSAESLAHWGSRHIFHIARILKQSDPGPRYAAKPGQMRFSEKPRDTMHHFRSQACGQRALD